MHKHKWYRLLTIFLVMVMLSGCMKEKPVIEELAKDGSGKLRVMYYDEEQFYREYGAFFSIEYPDIEIEVVSTNSLYQNNPDEKEPVDPEKRMLDFIDKEKPDVIMTDLQSMKKLVDAGKLYDLDPIIQQEKYNLDDILPGLIDLIREQGNGGLYGLAPKYYTQVMFYNADLFKEHGIEVPRNQMSWKEVLELGARFGKIGSGEDQIYGLANQYRTSADILFDMARTSNLQLVDARGEKVLIDSPAWREMFNTIVNAVNNNAIQVVKRDQNNEFGYSPMDSAFMSGKAAMAMESLWMAQQLENMSRWNPEMKAFDWQMVTMPVDPNSPNESVYVSSYTVLAINAEATNKRTAWELIKFINGPKMAKASSKITSGDLPTRIAYTKEIAGRSAEAATMLRPKLNTTDMYTVFAEQNISYEFFQTMNTIVVKAIDDMVAGKSADEVLPALQQDLQVKLVEAKKAGAKQAENAGAAGGGGDSVTVTPAG
ncbi:ABC transporter substrate-binding protein [Paenibacillus marinisediminis]